MPGGMRQTLTAEQLKKQGVTHTMLLCKIIIGKQQLGRGPMTKPDDGFDSARNGAESKTPGSNGIEGTYFIVFNPEHILPIAIIEYTISRKNV